MPQLQTSLNNHRLMCYKDDHTVYYSFLSLPYGFTQLSNHIVYYHLNDKKDILFQRVEYIQISQNKNQLSPKLIQFINDQFLNLTTIEIHVCELHQDLINNTKLILKYTHDINYYYHIKRLLLLTPNIQILIIDYHIILDHKRKLTYDNKLLPIRRQIKLLRIIDSSDRLDLSVKYHIQNKIFTNLTKFLVN